MASGGATLSAVSRWGFQQTGVYLVEVTLDLEGGAIMDRLTTAAGDDTYARWLPDDDGFIFLSYRDGDADANGVVDGDDFLLWQAQFGSPNGARSSAVPEPASWMLLAMVLCSALARRRR